MTSTTPRLLIVAALGLLALTGCAATTDTASPDTAATSTATAAASLTITDPWVKSAETGMSAAFGTLANASDTDINVVSAESTAATMIELHETVADDSGAMVMQQKEGGFVVPANGTTSSRPAPTTSCSWASPSRSSRAPRTPSPSPCPTGRR